MNRYSQFFFENYLFLSKTFFTIIFDERFTSVKKFWTNFFDLKNKRYFENFDIDDMIANLFDEIMYKFVYLSVLQIILTIFLNELFSWLYFSSLKYNELFFSFNNNWCLLNQNNSKIKERSFILIMNKKIVIFL